MSDFVAACGTGDLPPGSMTWVAVDRERVLLANVAGTFYALSDVCGHLRAPLSRGRLEGYSVECPLHFACFDVRTGALISGPGRRAGRRCENGITLRIFTWTNSPF